MLAACGYVLSQPFIKACEHSGKREWTYFGALHLIMGKKSSGL